MSQVIARRGDIAAQQDRPSAPLNVQATPGVGEVVLTWDAPANSGTGSVTDYSVTISPTTGVSGATTRRTNSPATGITFNGLTNGTAYSFIVQAINLVGTGPASSASSIVIPVGSQSAPATPTNLVATYNNNVLTFSFDEVANATSYRIETEFVSE